MRMSVLFAPDPKSQIKALSKLNRNTTEGKTTALRVDERRQDNAASDVLMPLSSKHQGGLHRDQRFKIRNILLQRNHV